MIKFFRQIRRRLLRESRFSQYLIYAIGEIILVVIGILIALQINNWNESQKEARQEVSILQNLNDEFLRNKEQLENYKSLHTGIIAATRKLLNLIGESDLVITQYNLDSLIAVSLDYRSYNPSQSVLSDLISSGRLHIISSNELREAIFQWSIALDEKNEAFKTLDEISQDLYIPFLVKNASLRNIDQYSLTEWKTKSKLKVDLVSLFQNLEFENHLENQLWDVTNYLMALEQIEDDINNIINLSQPTD